MQQEKEYLREDQREPFVEAHNPIAAEVPRQEETKRSRVFVSIYITFLLLAALIFVALAAFVRSSSLSSFDIAITQAVQSDHQPVYAWLLIHASDLGWFPGNVPEQGGGRVFIR